MNQVNFIHLLELLSMQEQLQRVYSSIPITLGPLVGIEPTALRFRCRALTNCMSYRVQLSSSNHKFMCIKPERTVFFS